MTLAPSFLSLPERLGQWYQPLGLLGAGTFGIVIKAQDRDQGNLVAIKLLKNTSHPEESERLMREGRVAGLLESEHIVRVLGTGWDRELPGGAPVAYLIMEYLEGRTLQSLIDEQGHLPVNEAVGYALEVCAALAEAHGHGPPFVHRDLKPSNIFLADGPRGKTLKVLDFGLVKVERWEEDGTAVDPLTRSKALAGTPAYMAPEQILRGTIEPRTDIWALGVLLFKMLTGHVPFQGASLPQTLVAVCRLPAPRLRSHRPGLPDELEAIIETCLTKDATRRHADVGALAVALSPFADIARRNTAARVNERLIRRLFGVRLDSALSTVRLSTRHCRRHGDDVKQLLLRHAAVGLSLASLLDAVRGLQGRGFVLSAVLIGSAHSAFEHAASLLLLSASLLAVAFAPRKMRWPLALATIVLGLLALLSLALSAAFFAQTQTLALQSAWPLPFSLLVAGMLSGFLWLAWREHGDSAGPTTRAQHLKAASIVGCAVLSLEVLFIHAFGLTDYRREADAILVLGARAYADGSPSEALAERVATGIDLYQQGFAPKLVMSGGIGKDGVSEPEVMQRLARAAGVPAAAIVIDAQGNNTEASICNLSHLGLKTRPKVLVVSHYHHLPRVKLLSKLHGVRSFTVPADEGETRLVNTPYYVLREAAGLVIYFVRG